MRPQQRVFRIETYQKNRARGSSDPAPMIDDGLAAARHAEILEAIDNLKVAVPSASEKAEPEVSETILKE